MREGIDRSRILHLPMAIEHAEVTGGDGARFRARLAVPPQRPLVGQLGALDPNKGSTDLIRALDATFPNGDTIPVKNINAEDGTKSCDAPEKSGEGLLTLLKLP